MVFSFLLWTGGGGCLCCAGVFFFFWCGCFILMNYLYYFNQIAKNIAPLLWDVRR